MLHPAVFKLMLGTLLLAGLLLGYYGTSPAYRARLLSLNFSAPGQRLAHGLEIFLLMILGTQLLLSWMNSAYLSGVTQVMLIILVGANALTVGRLRLILRGARGHCALENLRAPPRSVLTLSRKEL